MANYVDASCQTVWAGLIHRPIVRPDSLLFTVPDTYTPPDDLVTEKPQILESPSSNSPVPQAKPRLLDRRAMDGPKLVDKILLPQSKFDTNALLSPLPTHALLSPLPAANKLHAGHTPKVLRLFSLGEAKDEKVAQMYSITEAHAECRHVLKQDQPDTPDEDMALEGPLSLPTLPTVLLDGADGHIALHALDQELNRIAKEQERLSKLRDAPEPSPRETVKKDVSPSQRSSASRSYQLLNHDVPDGVILKSPRMNFGAPIGQVSRRRSEPSGSSSS